ncbi:HAMP domain-containing protein [Pseudoalteromonas sp. BMB]|uniref:HAMP domain-containing protein n=1 Tax=Pseudoalteromonas sp. BMB TaxID=1874619 RepID=UPI000AE8F383|nr:HAMP domain-containing protein [Pseudoalteromonas sp. BMB]
MSPLKQLKRSFKAIESGELDTRLALNHHDKVGEIISNFNNLAARLQRSHQQYKQINFDLSHELRTQLNGIRSRSEAMIDGFEAYRWQGNYYSVESHPRLLQECEVKGLIECLWDTFGGTLTDKGFKLLDEHIGAIYGDAITLERQRQILQRLMDKGFASKVVLGIGSYSYQYVTRDTHGSAVKATSVVKNNQRVAIFKEPKTDSKKRSAKGLLKVERVNGELICKDNVTEEEEKQGLLEVVFEDGKLLKETTLSEIRALIGAQIS